MIPNLSYSGGAATGGTAFNRSTNVVGASGGSATDYLQLMNILGDAPPANGGYTTPRDSILPGGVIRLDNATFPILPLVIAAAIAAYLVWKR